MRKLPHLLSFGFGALIFLALTTSGVDHARAQSAPATITVGRGPIAVAVDSTTHRFYVTSGRDTITILDPGTGPAVSTLPKAGARRWSA